MYLILCRPGLLRPSTLPHSMCFSIPFFLQMCPKNFICLSLMIFISDLLYIAISITSVLSFFSVHDILNILYNNISLSTLHKQAQAQPKSSKAWAWPMLVWTQKPGLVLG